MIAGDVTGEVAAASALEVSASPKPAAGLTVAIIVPTVGRAPTVRKAVTRLVRQSRAPDRVLVVGSAPADVEGVDQMAEGVEARLGPRGLCCQRNVGLAALGEAFDLICFFDDDFLPADDYLENTVRLFEENPDIVGATGWMIADGVNGPGYSFEQAEVIVSGVTQKPDWDVVPRRALYGCNMAFRASAIGDLRFDETLPLYGWQEDVDFSYRLARRGRLVKATALSGVHMGVKAGRTSGRRLGYSQIANPVYLLRKRSIPSDLALRIMRNNVISNLWKSVNPEPYIDRRGRLIGNLIAMRDLLTRRLHPGRIFELN